MKLFGVTQLFRCIISQSLEDTVHTSCDIEAKDPLNGSMHKPVYGIVWGNSIIKSIILIDCFSYKLNTILVLHYIPVMYGIVSMIQTIQLVCDIITDIEAKDISLYVPLFGVTQSDVCRSRCSIEHKQN